MHVLLLNSICITYYREILSRDKKEPENWLNYQTAYRFQKISAFKAPTKAITKAINLFSRLFQIKYQQISRYTSGSNRK